MANETTNWLCLPVYLEPVPSCMSGKTQHIAKRPKAKTTFQGCMLDTGPGPKFTDTDRWADRRTRRFQYTHLPFNFTGMVGGGHKKRMSSRFPLPPSPSPFFFFFLYFLLAFGCWKPTPFSSFWHAHMHLWYCTYMFTTELEIHISASAVVGSFQECNYTQDTVRTFLFIQIMYLPKLWRLLRITYTYRREEQNISGRTHWPCCIHTHTCTHVQCPTYNKTG